MDTNLDANAIDAVFVYGTLKRGQCRAGLWPAEPISIQEARVRGRLFGRFDYPAMTPGVDFVRGELWRFSTDLIRGVLETLDVIEGTNQPGQPDQYRRVVVGVVDQNGSSLGNAYTYHYATDPLEDGFHRIDSIEQNDVAWPS